MHGVKPRNPVVSEFDDDLQLRSQSYREYMSCLTRYLDIREQARLNIERCQGRSMEPGDSQFNEGDKVMLKVHAVRRGLSKKLSDRFKGPYEIISCRRPDYLISRRREKKFGHGCHLKKVDVDVTESQQAVDDKTLVDNVLDVQGVAGLFESIPPVESVKCKMTDAVTTDVSTEGEPVVSDDSVSVDGGPDASQTPDVYVTRYGRRVKPRDRLDL